MQAASADNKTDAGMRHEYDTAEFRLAEALI
jgi:hypothetical protein